jgi:hypothetical protein
MGGTDMGGAEMPGREIGGRLGRSEPERGGAGGAATAAPSASHNGSSAGLVTM